MLACCFIWSYLVYLCVSLKNTHPANPHIGMRAAAAKAAATHGSGSSSSSNSAPVKDKLAGVGLAFYAQIYVLQVATAA